MVAAGHARKLAVILALDVVSYSSLAEADDGAAIDLLRILRDRILKPAVSQHGGRIFKELGDGFLAEFASAAHGLQAAIAVQLAASREALPAMHGEPMQLRAALHTGEVIIEGDDLLGDTINIASRAQSYGPPGGICLTGAMYEQVAHVIEHSYVPLGPQKLKNILRPVTLFEIEKSSLMEKQSAGQSKVRQARPPLVAVLPLENLSGDEGLKHLCDGIAIEVITALSRFHSVRVLSASSSFAFEGVHARAREVGRSLNAEYVLHGSLMSRGSGLRLAMSLADSDSGTNCWTETYECQFNEILALQSSLAERVVGMVETRVFQARLARIERSPAGTVAAYDCWLRGQHLLNRWTAEADELALEWFERAISQDSGFARAHASIAAVLNTRTMLVPGNPNDAQDRERAMHHARLAVELDDTDARNHVNLAWGLMLARDFGRGARHFSLAEKFNPNAADILIACALGAGYLGEPQRARDLASRALELNPLHPDYYLADLVMIRVLGRDYSAAVELGTGIRESLPEISAWLAVAMSHMGHEEEARREGENFLRNITRSWAGPGPPSANEAVAWFLAVNAIKSAEDRALLLQGLRGAGLPVSGIRP